MTYPQPPYSQPQQGYPAQPGPYQQPGYAPQQPYQQPGYPPQAPPPGYGAPQGYGQQPPPPPADLPRGTIAGFWEQPAGTDGKALAFPDRAYGTRYVGTVIRDVTPADLAYQTDMRTGEIRKHPDGRLKQHLKVPLQIQPSPQYPEGIAVWYVKGADQRELLRAMAEAGCEPEADGTPAVPRKGDVIDITYVSDQPGRVGMAPAKIRKVHYTRAADISGAIDRLNPAPPVQAPPAQQPAAPGPYGQPQADWNPYAAQQQNWNAATGFAPQQPQVQYFPAQGTATQMQPPVQYAQPDPAQAYQQATGQQMPPQAPPGFPPAAAAPPPATAPPTAAASPSSPPPDWPADVPFIPGLTPEMARIAAQVGHPAARQQ